MKRIRIPDIDRLKILIWILPAVLFLNECKAESGKDDLPNVLAEREESSVQIIDTLNTIEGRLQTLMGDKGYDLTTMISSALDESSTLQDVRTKTDEVSNTVTLVSKIVENEFGGIDEPIVLVE